MARLPRYTLLGHPQHVIQRGNNRSTIFQGEGDYLFYLQKLQQSSEKHGCLIHAYVLMTNHVHLLVSPEREDSISKMQQMLGRYYVQYFNYRYRRTGTLWEGRYRATLIDTDTYLFTCMRYIEMNPVRAQMVTHPSEYRWSSYHANVGGTLDPVIHQHSEYQSLGPSDELRRQRYKNMHQIPISQHGLDAIREATNKGWVLGSEGFKHQLEKTLNRPAMPAAKGGDRRSLHFRGDKPFNRV